MTPKATARSASLESRRVPIERPVRLRFPHFETFVSEFSKNVSLTGMFISSTEPKPPGTVFDFDFRVSDDWELIHGKAQVVWVREHEEGRHVPAGMGVRFIELDSQSLRLIRWLVERQLISGESSFDLGPVPKELDRSLPPDSDRQQSALSPRFSAGTGLPRSATAREVVSYHAARRRRRRLWLGLPLLMLLLAAAGWYLYRTDLAAGLRSGLEDSAGEGASPPSTAREGSRGEPAAEDDGEATSTRAGAELDISRTIRSWADSWSKQRLQDYLRHYADDFEPAGGLSRDQWRALRRERLAAPLYIRVALTALEIEWLAEDRVEARFFQSYRSDRYSDTVRKALLLERRESGWQILRETVLPGWSPG